MKENLKEVYVLIVCGLLHNYDWYLSTEYGDPIVEGVYKTKEKLIEKLSNELMFTDESIKELFDNEYIYTIDACYYLEKTELK